MPKTTIAYRVDVTADQVTGVRPTLTLNKALVKRLRPLSSLLSVLKGIAGTYMFLFGVFAIVRYIRRAGDKEVSHQRTALATMVWAAFPVLLFYDPGYLSNMVGGEPEFGSDRLMLQISIGIGMILMGAVFGIAYGAGEGGLRESYTGKLTSLDALLSGRLFSANVAQSVLRGGGIAGWLLLLQNLSLLATHQYRAGAFHDAVASSFLKLPLGALVMDRFTDAVVQTTFGLLLPIVLFRPRIQKQRLYFGLLAVCATVSAGLTVGEQNSWVTLIVAELALIGALYIPFATGDLLAGMCGFFALRFVGGLVERSAISEQWLDIFLWDVAPAGVAFLLAQVYFAWRGRVYDEEEVRPRYARNLAEHISMEAEIGAARLAQLRLLPGTPPTISGLSIAGSCVPARQVGGDFYDFYPLDANRLGVFLAEGGSRELGSAMTIALAKGYLLYSSGLDLSPAEILRRLLDAMPTALHGSASMSVLYAVIDSRAGTVRFARTGKSPRLLINGAAVTEELAADSMKPVRHGLATLTPHDMLVFFTDGLAVQIAERKRQWTDKFVQKLQKNHPNWSAAELHSALLKAAVRGKQQPPDDITSVVIRMEEPTVQQMGVVA
jgi:hypothetical protein